MSEITSRIQSTSVFVFLLEPLLSSSRVNSKGLSANGRSVIKRVGARLRADSAIVTTSAQMPVAFIWLTKRMLIGEMWRECQKNKFYPSLLQSNVPVIMTKCFKGTEQRATLHLSVFPRDEIYHRQLYRKYITCEWR